MFEHGMMLMAAGMGTVGAFLTTMVFAMFFSGAIINRWFPEKEKAKPAKPKPKAKTLKTDAAYPKTATSAAPTAKPGKKASSNADNAKADKPTENSMKAKAS